MYIIVNINLEIYYISSVSVCAVVSRLDYVLAPQG